MHRYADRTLIIFVHIPKAAGRTLQHVLANRFDASTIWRWHSGEIAPRTALGAMSAAQRDELLFISGHFAFGLHTAFSRPTQYLTVLRHPVDRLASHYAYVRGFARHSLHQMATAATFEEYATQLLNHRERDNGQVRQIARAHRVPEGALTTAHLRTAIDNLEQHFPLVGVQDRFDEFVGLVSQWLGMPRKEVQRQHVSPSGSVAISPKLYRKIISQNCFDWTLYEWARNRQQELVQEYAANTE